MKVIFTMAVGVILVFSVISTVVIDVCVYIISLNAVVFCVVCIVSNINSFNIYGAVDGIIIVIVISGSTIITVIITV